MEELHELTGTLSLITLIIVTLSGVIIYKFRYFKKWLQYGAFKKMHILLAALLTAGVAVHFLTTDERHPLLIGGMILLGIVFILALALRMGKGRNAIIIAKITLLAIASVLLLVGHEVADEHEHNGVEHSEYHENDDHGHDH